MIKNEQAIDVHLPIDVVYEAWTRFETFPRFMLGLHDVTPLDDTTLRWQADIGGRQREWTTVIDEQTPDTHVRWRNAEQPTYTYDVSLEPIGGAPQTRVTIQLEYDDDAAELLAGDASGGVAGRISSDLHRFKSFVESRYPTDIDAQQDGQEKGTSVGRESRIDGQGIGTVKEDGEPQVVVGGNTSGLVGDTVNGLGGAPDRI